MLLLQSVALIVPAAFRPTVRTACVGQIVHHGPARSSSTRDVLAGTRTVIHLVRRVGRGAIVNAEVT